MHAPLEMLSSRGVKAVGDRADRAASRVRARAVIRGTGMLTALGTSVEETWEGLMAGGYIRDHSAIPLPDDGSGRPRVNQLAVRAARQAVGGPGWSLDLLRSDETALVVGTSKGSIENWMGVTPLPGVVGRNGAYGLADTGADVARDLGLGRGARLTVSAACATGLHALIRGTMLIETGAARRVLVVAAESSLGALFVGSFKRLGVLAKDGCRPFDVNRTGFLMSEGAAAVCLEAESEDGEAGVMKVESYAMGADATHLTGGDREGETLRHLMTTVMDGRGVDFVHAHGTGTEINDATELAAIEASLDGPCPVYSHKGALGHSLGAAGLFGVVLNAVIHSRGVVPPNVRTGSPMATRRAVVKDVAADFCFGESAGSNPPATSHNAGYVKFDQGGGKRRSGCRSLVVAAGFGGAAAVVSLVS